MTLSDPEPSVRIAFVKKLAAHADAAAVPQLLRALNDDDWFVRNEAVLGLASWRDEPKVVDALIEVLLDDFHSSPRMNSSSILAGAPGFRQWLLDALRSADTRERANALIGEDATRQVLSVQAMRRSGDLELLVACLQYGTFEVRIAAADALGEMGDPEAIPALERASVDDEVPGVRSAASAALERVHLLSEGDEMDRLIDRLRGSDFDKRKDAVTRLGDLGAERAVDVLTGLLVDLHWLFPYASERGKIKSPPDSLAVEFPTAAADALAATKDERAADALLQALGSPEPAVRMAAARALASLGDQRAVDLLARLAQNDSYKYFPDMDSNEVRYPVREAAKEALASMGSEIDALFQSRIQAHTATVANAGAREVLEKHLPWSAEDVEELERLSDEDMGAVADLLLKRIEQDPPSFDRMASSLPVCRLMVRAVEQGGAVGEKAGAAVLRVILGRHRALDRGRKRAGIAGMRPDNVDIITEAWSCLDELDARPASAAADLENDDVAALMEKLFLSPDDRTEIVAELGKRNDARAVGPLLDVLGDAYRMKDRKCAERVVKALASLAKVDTAAVARGLSHEVSEVRWAVAELLGDVADQAAKSALMNARDDPDEGVREAVSVAIERIESR